ncbi:hypothetical protein QBC32DRAFT_355048 [Pseudoneurospora amorphoporcata]|uniref:AAA+ ATPase domain-containing protein n=1 Tax=Pseudoneurospora amorphoporcata TaxID=241081 RepID=A0AAN6NLU2_9PEZI|nr:hypothetical protein QBC32DRAFT_355048 [Pseudoneurospora amorphoporcata]
MTVTMQTPPASGGINGQPVTSPQLSDSGSNDATSAADSPTQSSQEAASTDGQIQDPASNSKDNNDNSASTVTEQSKPADETSKTESSQEPGTEDADEKWAAEKQVDLWCKITGESHYVLLKFGTWKCPICEQSLVKPEPKQKKSKEPDENASGPSDTNEGSNEFLYSVRYLDEAHVAIMTEEWKGPFNLAEARKDVMEKEPMFKVQTDLVTSIPHEKYRSGFDIKRIKEAGILNNANLSVKVNQIRLTIQSAALLNVIRKVVTYYPDVNLQAKTLDIATPYAVLWHHWPQFEEHLAHQHAYDNKDPGKHQLRHLLNFVKSANGKTVDKERIRHGEGMCTYDMLWLLYKPGKMVYVETYGRISAFVISRVKYKASVVPNQQEDTPPGYMLWLWCLDYDGSFVGRRPRSVYIPPFEGERRINELRVIPCENQDAEDEGKTREALIEDGRKWYRLLRGGQFYYSGRLLDDRQKEFKGRVYVDSASFYHNEGEPRVTEPSSEETSSERAWAATSKRQPILGISDMGQGLARCPCEECHGFRPHPPQGFPWTHYDLLDPVKNEDLELSGAEDPEHRYLLCGRKVFGFDLRSREWLMLDASFCEEAGSDEKAIDRLVMPEERKYLIKALIQKYSDTKDSSASDGGPWKADFIENKGEGQIFLLHGSPGVGKTFAECIAEYTGRPLLSLTCADIGINEIEMEKKLLKWFQLAEKWGAVMLIDEADVFLERRSNNDLRRNSLVSVFLRCVEYYRGVLFLTTNRVGQFDDAFMSRIHVIIHYKTLSPEDRRRIWQQFFDKLEEDRQDFGINDRARDYVLCEDDSAADSSNPMANMELNGREIRNAFQTAVALAEFRHKESLERGNKKNAGKKTTKGPVLDRKDFEQVCRMIQEFKGYLKALYGADEEDRAYHLKTRVPAYDY